MWLGDVEANVTIKTYPAGHMIYTHLDALAAITEDVKRFYGEALNAGDYSIWPTS
jgi:hypothetical protein